MGRIEFTDCHGSFRISNPQNISYLYFPVAGEGALSIRSSLTPQLGGDAKRDQNTFLLEPLGLTYLQTLAYILVIASLVQFVEMFLQKAMPALYEALGVYLPLITTNCAVLGVALQNTQNGYNLFNSIIYGVTGGIGFLIAIVLFASVRERMEFSESPKSFEGFPIALVAAGLIALAFCGFSGLKIF